MDVLKIKDKSNVTNIYTIDDDNFLSNELSTSFNSHALKYFENPSLIFPFLGEKNINNQDSDSTLVVDDNANINSHSNDSLSDNEILLDTDLLLTTDTNISSSPFQK
ncbi:hypothetical protein WA158_006939 [Blastocystis sp. Blastoise]